MRADTFAGRLVAALSRRDPAFGTRPDLSFAASRRWLAAFTRRTAPFAPASVASPRDRPATGDRAPATPWHKRTVPIWVPVLCSLTVALIMLIPYAVRQSRAAPAPITPPSSGGPDRTDFASALPSSHVISVDIESWDGVKAIFRVRTTDRRPVSLSAMMSRSDTESLPVITRTTRLSGSDTYQRLHTYEPPPCGVTETRVLTGVTTPAARDGWSTATATAAGPRCPSLETLAVTMKNPSLTVTCGKKAEIIAIVGTNGAAGTLRYQWLRSDSKTPITGEETVSGSERLLTLSLDWTFTGKGTTRHTATLRVLDPVPSGSPPEATTTITYSC
ncbi:hypothetical protein [Sphaerisporangium aureirubrum]|uniref:Ig-like domain-containing protein n=1 Tax=Sphaerisporangium aureirubrum TaxID=1544736 RepID=A0ABW1NTH0_9ACTN